MQGQAQEHTLTELRKLAATTADMLDTVRMFNEIVRDLIVRDGVPFLEAQEQAAAALHDVQEVIAEDLVHERAGDMVFFSTMYVIVQDEEEVHAA